MWTGVQVTLFTRNESHDSVDAIEREIGGPVDIKNLTKAATMLQAKW